MQRATLSPLAPRRRTRMVGVRHPAARTAPSHPLEAAQPPPPAKEKCQKICRAVQGAEHPTCLGPCAHNTIATGAEDLRKAGKSKKAKARTNPKGSRDSRDFAAGVGRALRLAAKEARRIASIHGRPIYVWENSRVSGDQAV